ncbi:MAG: hypothetical protein RSD94_15085, partial [Acinetobacter sp.]
IKPGMGFLLHLSSELFYVCFRLALHLFFPEVLVAVILNPTPPKAHYHPNYSLFLPTQIRM